MWHPLQLIPDGLIRWIILIVLLIGGTIVSRQVSKPFKEKEYGGLDIEFAGNKEKAKKIVDYFKDENVDVNQHLRWDNFYIVLYSLCLALACVMCASAMGGAFPSGFYLFLAWCAFVAGLMDYIENYSISLMLKEIKSDTLPQIAFWSASIKFLLIGGCILFVLIKFVTWGLLKTGLLKHGG